MKIDSQVDRRPEIDFDDQKPRLSIPEMKAEVDRAPSTDEMGSQVPSEKANNNNALSHTTPVLVIN